MWPLKSKLPTIPLTMGRLYTPTYHYLLFKAKCEQILTQMNIPNKLETLGFGKAKKGDQMVTYNHTEFNLQLRTTYAIDGLKQVIVRRNLLRQLFQKEKVVLIFKINLSTNTNQSVDEFVNELNGLLRAEKLNKILQVQSTGIWSKIWKFLNF